MARIVDTALVTRMQADPQTLFYQREAMVVQTAGIRVSAQPGQRNSLSCCIPDLTTDLQCLCGELVAALQIALLCSEFGAPVQHTCTRNARWTPVESQDPFYPASTFRLLLLFPPDVPKHVQH